MYHPPPPPHTPVTPAQPEKLPQLQLFQPETVILHMRKHIRTFLLWGCITRRGERETYFVEKKHTTRVFLIFQPSVSCLTLCMVRLSWKQAHVYRPHSDKKTYEYASIAYAAW